jgi:hypothetical protein
MARDRNTYAKRQRENEKRQKAEAKRARRVKRKDDVKDPAASSNADHQPLTERPLF